MSWTRQAYKIGHDADKLGQQCRALRVVPTEISPNDSGVLIRIKAGPSSGALVVNRIELCMQAS